MSSDLRKARLWLKTAAALNLFFTLLGIGLELTLSVNGLYIAIFWIVWILTVAFYTIRGYNIYRRMLNEH